MPDLREKSEDPALQLASIIEESIVDGPGLRFTVFAQGCPHRCRGCHNPQTHLSVGGTMFTPERLLTLYDEHPFNRGITLSGGEPFAQAEAMAVLAKSVHRKGGDVVTYTGYRLEKLQLLAQDDSGVKDLLDATDLLIDGRFILAQRCLELPFAGSLNQRFIALSDLGKCLLDNIPVLAGGPAIERIVNFAS